MAGKEIQLLHLAFLEKFIDEYLKSKSRRTSLLRELDGYNKSLDPDIQEIAKMLSTIYNDFLNYTNPRDVSTEKRERLQKLITAKRDKINRVLDSGPSVAQTVSSSRAKTITITHETKKETRNPVVDPLGLVKKQLDNSLEMLVSLEKDLQKSKSNPLKAAYKKGKKMLLSSIGKEHNSKLAMAKQMKSELTNLRNSLDNVGEKISSDTAIIKILETQQRIQHMQKNRVELFKKTNNPLNKLLENLNAMIKTQATTVANNFLIEYANKKYGSAHDHFGKYIDSLKDKDKYKQPMYLPTSGNYQANDPNLKAGDFLNLFYPLPKDKENRDQLSIDAFGEFSNDENNKNTELYAIGSIMTALKSVEVNMDKLKETITKYGNDPDIYDRVITEINRNIESLHSGEIDKLKDPAAKQMVKDLVKSVEKNVNDYYESIRIQPQDKRAPSN